MGFGSSVYAVDGAGSNVHRGVKPKGEIGAGKIVVDGLGDTDYLDSILKELLRDGERVVAADRDERIAAVGLEIVRTNLQAVGALGGIGARGAEDGAAA